MFSFPACRSRRDAGAFTLVEVTLALGIVAFALVAIIGVMPLALSTERLSFDEGQASAVANTLFATFRGQSFNSILFVDAQYDTSGNAVTTPPGGPAPSPTPINLSTVTVPSPPNLPSSPTTILYATFLSVASDTDVSKGVAPSPDTIGDQRRLCFTSNPPSGGADFQVALYFSLPAGVFSVPLQPRQAIQMEVDVTPYNHSASTPSGPTPTPPRQFHFVSTLINHSN